MKTILVNALCMLFITTALAQNKLEGVVSDASTNEFIVWGNIVLYQGETIFKGVITSEKGKFKIDDIPSGDYLLKASYIGYRTSELAVTITEEKSTNLKIALEPEAAQLEAVVVQAEITTIQHKSDRKIVNVGKDLLASGTLAVEILGQLPSIKVDTDNNISLRGDQNVKILVNGRNSSLPNDRLLQQLPSSAIEKIEIINNPSAKYQAEGLSGIINIITKKSYLKGANVGITLGAGTGSEARLNGNISASYATDKIKIYANYSYNKGFKNNLSTFTGDRETLSYLTNRNDLNKWKTPAYLKSGVDFKIDATNTLSAFVEFSKYDITYFTNDTTVETLNSNPQNPNAYTIVSDGIDDGKDITYNLNYRKEFNTSDNYLEFDANYAPAIAPFTYDNERTVTFDAFTETQTENYISNFEVLTLSSDYFNRNDNRTWEFGIRTELRDLDELQQRSFINATTTNFNTDFNYNDGIYAAYAIFNKGLGKFNIKGGIRAEHTQLKLVANESQQTNNYTNLFPSLSASYKKDGHNLSFSYSRRIARPGFSLIGNFTFQEDQYNQFRGNPELQPEFSNKFELSYSKNFDGFNLNSSLFANRKENTIRFNSVIEGDNIVTSSSNVGNSTGYGLELFTRFKPTTWWNANINATYYYDTYSASEFLNQETFRQSYSFNNTFKPMEGLRIQANISLNPKYTDIQTEYQGTYATSIAVSKDLFNKKGSISLRANDIFNSGRTRSTGSVNGFDFNSTSIDRSSRHLYLTFKYNFNFGNKKLTEKDRERKQREYTNRG